MQETWVRSLGQEDPLAKEMATHFSILASRIPWMEEPGGLQSTGSQRVGHDWATELNWDIILIKIILTQTSTSMQIISSLKLEDSEIYLQFNNLCNPMDCSLLGYSIHGIFQARVLEWVAISFARGSSWPRDRAQVSCIIGRCFAVWATGEVSIINITILFIYTYEYK